MEKLKTIYSFILIFFLSIILFSQTLSFSETEPIIAKDLEYRAKKLYNIQIEVTVVPNSKTKLQDLYIKPKTGQKYPSEDFIFSVARTVGALTGESFTYKLYTGMVIIEVNEELWAISAEKCREVFKEKTSEKQLKLLQENLKWLR